MKYNEKQYAQALFGATRDKSRNEIKPMLESFVNLLSNNNDLAKAEKIIDNFIAISDGQAGFLSAEVSSARELDRETVGRIKHLIAGRTGAREVAVDRKIDNSLLGGAIIKYRDKVLDASLKSNLLDLKEKMIR